MGNYVMLKFPQKSAALSMEKALLNEIKAELQDTIDVIKNPEDIARLRGFLHHLKCKGQDECGQCHNEKSCIQQLRRCLTNFQWCYENEILHTPNSAVGALLDRCLIHLKTYVATSSELCSPDDPKDGRLDFTHPDMIEAITCLDNLKTIHPTLEKWK